MEHFILPVVNCLIGLAVAAIWRRLATSKAQQDAETEAIRSGVQALLRDRIIQGHRYFTSVGFIGIAERESFEAIYTAYKGLGADGVIDDIVARVRALPLAKEINNE